MKRTSTIFLSLFAAAMLVMGLVFQLSTPQNGVNAQSEVTPTATIPVQPTLEVTELVLLAESATPEALVPFLATGITMNGPAASTDPNAWSAHVVVTSVATGEILIDQQIYGRTDFVGAPLCEPVNVVSDKPLTGDLDFDGNVTDMATGTVTTLGFGDDVALGLTSQWDINHSSNVCAFSLWEESVVAPVVITSATATPAWKAHLRILDINGAPLLDSHGVAIEYDIYGRTEFHASDLAWINQPFIIESDQPLKADCDYECTVTLVSSGVATDYGFAISIHLPAGQSAWVIKHSTNPSFALQEDNSILATP